MARKKEEPKLDELVRQKVTEEFDVPFREEDWQAMNRSLVTRERHRLHVRRWRWVAVASLLIAVTLGVAALLNHLRLNEMSRQLADGAEQIRPHVPLLPVPELENHLQPSDGDMDMTQESGRRGQDRALLDPDDVTDVLDMSDPTSGIGEMGDLVWKTDAADSDNRAFLRTETPTPVAWASIQVVPQVAPPVRSVASLGREDQLQVKNGPIERDPLDLTETDPRMVRGLTLGLVLAPDVSMAGGMPGFDSPGLKAGLTLDLDVGSGLSLQTGVIYSGVRYSGDGGLYNPNGYAYGSVAGPESLHAVCHLLDIPVSLRVRLHEGERSRIVAGAGVSSYIMLNERYRFNYAQYAPGQLREWEGATGTRHWASHASLSVGYEVSLVPGWSLRAEPYLRLPIRNVGRANVKLYSIGTLFSLGVDL